MPQPRNRSLETRVAVVEEQLADLRTEIHGGPGLDRKDSVRGRLHDLAEKVGTTEALRHYAERLEEQAELQSSRHVAVMAVLVAAVASIPGWVALIITLLS